MQYKIIKKFPLVIYSIIKIVAFIILLDKSNITFMVTASTKVSQYVTVVDCDAFFYTMALSGHYNCLIFFFFFIFISGLCFTN